MSPGVELDVSRVRGSVLAYFGRIMLAGGFKGTFALEYEQGPLNGVEGAKYLYKEVLTALTTPTPVVGA